MSVCPHCNYSNIFSGRCASCGKFNLVERVEMKDGKNKETKTHRYLAKDGKYYNGYCASPDWSMECTYIGTENGNCPTCEEKMKQKTEGLTGEDIEKIYCDVFGYTSYKLSPEFKQFLIRIGVEIKKPEVTIPLTARQIEKAFDKFSGSSYSWMDRVLKELGF